MIKLNEVLVVEGRYDKNTLSQIFDTAIIETGGFRIFSDREKLSLLRRLAETRGLVVLTDSDGAGFLIRNHLKGAIDPKYVKHAYIPDIMGREKRKSSPSKEGKLGVEGMKPEVIIESLRRAGVSFEQSEGEKKGEAISKADLYELGLFGGADSGEKRSRLLRSLELPERLTANSLLQVLNILMSRDEFLKLFDENGEILLKLS